jgi:hypothetical protein
MLINYSKKMKRKIALSTAQKSCFARTMKTVSSTLPTYADKRR